MAKTKILTPEGKDLMPNKGRPHIASRSNVGWNLDLFFNILPDPDLILKKLGKPYSALREITNDDQFETAWTSRISSVTKPAWFIEPGDNTASAKKAADFIKEVYDLYKMEEILPQLLEYCLYGFIPAEIPWQTDASLWVPPDIIAKPPEWFAFDADNNLVLRTRSNKTETLPPNRFLLLRNRPSYINPYGNKLLSKIYWPWIFRKNGAQWWATFTEKFGAAFATAKYRPGAVPEEIDDIINMLEDLVSCGVAAFPEGTNIDILTDTSKGAATNNFNQFQSCFTASISKVLLGATLTTDIGEVGSKSAAQVHNDVREDIALADRKTISDAFNSLNKLTSRVNFGDNIASPVFKWEQAEDLKTERLGRDEKLYAIGWRPSAEYIAESYNIPKEQFFIQESTTSMPLFTETTEKTDFTNNRAVSDLELQEQFNQEQFSAGQSLINSLIEDYHDAIQTAQTFDEAQQILISKYKKHAKLRENFAQILDNIRFFASQIGVDSSKSR